jgi:porin
MLRRFGVLGVLCAGAWVTAAPALAAEKSIWERETLTGDWGGQRSTLKERALEFTFAYIGEVLGVVSGGLARRGSYEGRFEFSADADLEKLIGWKGASAHATIYQIHSTRQNAAANVGSIADPSNIDAVQTTRLFTLWFQQNWWDDRLSLRAGQLAADDEFITAPTAGGLINGTFGWPALASANLRSEGPAYPLAAPGLRVAIKPSEQWTFMTALFAGDPSGGNCNDLPQICNRHGTEFTWADGVFWINELQFGVNQGKQAAGLPGIYKLGAWYASAHYADQRFPISHAGNWGVYAVADQMIWRAGATSLNVFVRTGATPSDRNLVSYYADGGVGIKGLLAGRPDDQLTFGAAYLNISPEAASADRAAGLAVIRNNEMVFEASYQAQLAPWWILQPDVQHMVHPGGKVPDPNNPLAPVKNATVIGLRSIMKF